MGLVQFLIVLKMALERRIEQFRWERQGLLRRGLTVAALREFILAQGASKNVTYQEWDKIWSINKRMIDPVCPRHTAVRSAGKVPLRLTNVTATDYITLDRHNKNPAAGKKVTQRGPVCSRS